VALNAKQKDTAGGFPQNEFANFFSFSFIFLFFFMSKARGLARLSK
jgi:hypothetical protein